jgi:hypothetical protein
VIRAPRALRGVIACPCALNGCGIPNFAVFKIADLKNGKAIAQHASL